MRHILGVLQGMGVAITEESKFRLRCVRPLRRDSAASDTSRSSEDSVNSVSSFDYDNPSGVPAAGTLFTGGGDLAPSGFPSHPRQSHYSVSGTPLVGHVNCVADQVVLALFRLSILDIRIPYTAIKARILEARSASASS
jgi:hypothetical protein